MYNIMFFHEHGDTERQYLTGTPDATYDDAFFELAKYNIRSYLRRMKDWGEDVEEAKSKMMERYGIDSLWFEGAFDKEVMAKDSLEDLKTGIIVEEIPQIAPNVRLTIFDACYNGDFRNRDFIAGRYIMSEGGTVACFANSANVLQDKWADELIGMLALGFRVGQWQREVNTLESHMTGDPTYRFVSEDGVDNSVCMSNALVLEKDNIDYWSGLMDSKSCTGRALAVKRISELRKDYSHELLRMFRKEGSIAVKLQILDAMMNYGNSDRDSLLLLALKDNSELVRRLSTYHACRVGKDIFIEPVLNNYLFHNEAQRVIYASETNLKLFDMEKVQETGNRLLEASNLMDVNYAVDVFNKSVAAQKKRLKADIDVIFDKSASYDRRESAIRGLRNYPMSQYASVLASFVADPSQDENLRVVMCEALGWFNMSFAKDEIIGILEPLSVDATISGRLREEALKSCKRLKTTSDI